MIRKQDALDYHSMGKPGKVEVTPTKPCLTQRDLSLAYTPGVADPCLEIEKNPEDAYKYTAKGNLVAVITNGTAVLGLGKIGALAGKPVMEGKGVLFKKFANVDVFDIELDTRDADEIIKTCQLLEPTFGGINLEDIAAPDCFYIEETLKETMRIPVFHDDQHGTAIISGAALLNAAELVDKDLDKMRVVYNGAGAAGIACAAFYIELGINPENMLLCDSKGVIYEGREDMDPFHPRYNKYKARFARKTDCRTLDDAMKDADVFCGVSVKDTVTKDMVKSMAKDPIIFAMANPDPEITYPDAVDVRKDVIMATGRSDFPNQVNNVLGFPFIFRGALDVRATAINEPMKVAAAYALANLAKQDVPDSVCRAYGVANFTFGPEYIIPKPFDPRVLLWEAPAVAKAAVETGVALIPYEDFDQYRDSLESHFGASHTIMRKVIYKAKAEPKKIVFPEGTEDKILRAAQIIVDEGIGTPIILGPKESIEKRVSELGLDLKSAEIVDNFHYPKLEEYKLEFLRLRQRHGITPTAAEKFMHQRNYFGMMMVHMGDADCLVAGVSQNYPETIRPALQIVRTKKGNRLCCGVYMMVFPNRVVFFADTTVNVDNDAPEDLAEIAISAAEVAKSMDIEPKIAMLSFSNFGSVKHKESAKVRKAVEIVKGRYPDLIIDGEMQADTAVDRLIQEENYSFCELGGEANILIFPDMQSGNIAYKLVGKLGGATAIGPILKGISKPVHVLQRGCSVDDIVNIASIAVVDAQSNAE
ncbi:NADP-dependent malic enzyme [candidate division LCP-89 bacterium B3_LCP]|uniref:NADP-dependent malic enzyme n=1 Tax=candidate division LCP-89 bacterium B3_LCP TaxID=2012998 RepID=A0A532V1K7_UNCL8|nr:MAG: NADP-dependent malic enzyme [candidate division LCP-89 bacterium B3_LCP]